MGTAKRERQKAGRQARLDQAKVDQSKKQRFRLVRNLAIVGVVVIALLFVLSRGEDDGDDDVATATSTTATTVAGQSSTTLAETAATVVVTLPSPGAEVDGDTECPPADGSAERTTTFAAAPPTCIDADLTYTATIVTSEGEFVVELDDEAAPVTVNNFVVLARYHYYDGVPFHRIIPGFMNQAGDAIGPSPGQGGPGYTIPDELPADPSAYVEGSFAMANAGPDTGGSQFFVVVGDGGQQLSADYSLFGQVTSGIEVVRAINEFGDAASNGTPTRDIVIESITIVEG